MISEKFSIFFWKNLEKIMQPGSIEDDNLSENENDEYEGSIFRKKHKIYAHFLQLSIQFTAKFKIKRGSFLKYSLFFL